jgi:Putative polyhydroxyalkanoic acid system protein (PHA_gran_rgn)
MNTPVTVSVKHCLGKAEAVRRLKSGFAHLRGNLALVAIEQEVWVGDTLRFHMHALGQSAAGTMEVLEDCVRIEVSLSWLLAKISERLLPSLRKETTLLLEKK